MLFKIIQDFIKPGGGVIKEWEIGGGETEPQTGHRWRGHSQIQLMEQTALIISKIA
jgi:hypothetical protein